MQYVGLPQRPSGQRCNAGGGSVSITGLPAEWTPGVTYPLEVSVSHSGASRYGFQMTAVDSNGAQAGEFVIVTGTAIRSGSVGGKTIEHMQHSVASPNNTFSFSWTAPETSSTGAVKFNVAANAASRHGNFNQGGDFIYSTETSVGTATLAPGDPAAFDNLVIGQRMLSSLAPASLYHVDFVEAGRFEATEGAATYAGSYSYTNTGPDTGTVVFNYDHGDTCTNSVTFDSPTTGSLTYTCNDGTSGETNWRLVDDPDYVPLTPPETGTGGTESFSIPDRGGTSTTSSGSADTLRVGYGRIRADAGSSTPAGIAIFQFRDSEGVLISEAGVPASEPVQEGRIFAEVNGPVNTGLAIANPNDVPATISFYFTDTSGTRFADGSLELGAHQQTAKFLDQEPFNSGSSVLGTFTFTSSVPVAVVALRGFTNEASEFLMTTLPVAPLSSTSSDTVYFPHFSDGSGWATQVVLVNPTDRTITGTVGFLGQGSDTAPAAPVVLTLDDGQSGSSFDYSIPSRSAQRFTTANPPGGLARGSVRATPQQRKRRPLGAGRLLSCLRWKDRFRSRSARVAQRVGIPCLCRSVRDAGPGGLDPKRTGHRQHGRHSEYGDAGGDRSGWIAGGSPGDPGASTLGPDCPFSRRAPYTAGQLFRSAPGDLHGRCDRGWTPTANQRERGVEDDDDPAIRRNGAIDHGGDCSSHISRTPEVGPHSSSCTAAQPARPRLEH